MTAFELLAYVVTFVLCLGLVISLLTGVFMLVERNKAVKEYLKRKGGGLNGNKSNKEE